MPPHPHSAQKRKSVRPTRSRDLRVLVVDRDPRVGALVGEVMDERPVDLRQVATRVAAEEQLNRQAADLAIVELDLPGESGLRLAEDLVRRHRTMQTMMTCRGPSFQHALDAVRVGVVDFLPKPLEVHDLRLRLGAAVDRFEQVQARRKRLRRLKRTCRKLNRLRLEVADQVDVLCNDLVTAYQELAHQMQQVMHASEFGAVMNDELDLEHLLRKTLEFLLGKVGPTNAAIFLPGTGCGFTLGGYVNHDCASESVDQLLEHLAETVVPGLSDLDAPLLISDNEQLEAWFGDDAAYLIDSHVLVFNCEHDDELLAVVMLFRDMTVPYEPSAIDAVTTIGPMLGDHLSRVIRIHHRHLAWPGDEPGGWSPGD